MISPEDFNINKHFHTYLSDIDNLWYHGRFNEKRELIQSMCGPYASKEEADDDLLIDNKAVSTEYDF